MATNSYKRMKQTKQLKEKKLLDYFTNVYYSTLQNVNADCSLNDISSLNNELSAGAVVTCLLC